MGSCRLPEADRDKPKKFKKHDIGYCHIDIAELRYEGSKGFLMSRDRPRSWCSPGIYRRATKPAAAAFLRVLIKTVPYKIHMILTDNGAQFVQQDQGGAPGWIGHIFGRVGAQTDIEQ